MSRADGRAADELRPVEIELDFIPSASGSALFAVGSTRADLHGDGRGVGAAVDARPRHRLGHSEYGMLPGSTSERKSRDASRGRVDGRTVEIQRLVGRSLRSVVDFKALGERTVWIDCDVIQADGGTRCAAICGGYVALHLALSRLVDARRARRACRCATRSPPCRWGSSTASRCSTCPTPRTAAPRWT